MEYSLAIFCSENANSYLACQSRNVLKKYNFYTAYVQDIDEILLKKFNVINFLILDLTDTELDFKTKNLLNKLVEQNYIRRFLIIKDKDSDINYDLPIAIKCGPNFAEDLSNAIDKAIAKPISDTKVCDATAIKIIGTYLNEIGISLKSLGFGMLVNGLIYLYSNNGIMKSLSKNLYVYLGNMFSKNVDSVEIAIRKSISEAYKNGKKFPFDHCPTNKEFIMFVYTELYDKIFSTKIIRD